MRNCRVARSAPPACASPPSPAQPARGSATRPAPAAGQRGDGLARGCGGRGRREARAGWNRGAPGCNSRRRMDWSVQTMRFGKSIPPYGMRTSISPEAGSNPYHCLKSMRRVLLAVALACSGCAGSDTGLARGRTLPSYEEKPCTRQQCTSGRRGPQPDGRRCGIKNSALGFMEVRTRGSVHVTG